MEITNEEILDLIEKLAEACEKLANNVGGDDIYFEVIKKEIKKIRDSIK